MGDQRTKALIAKPRAEPTHGRNPAKTVPVRPRPSSAVALDFKPVPGTSSPTPVPPRPMRDGTFLVDGATGDTQMTSGAFLSALRREVESVAENELEGTGWTVEHCPWLEYWFAYYGTRSAADVETSLLKYAPEAACAERASDYFEPVALRVRKAIARWRTTGEIDAPAAPIPEPIVVQASLGPGRALESRVRSRMESAMETDLSATRLHSNGVAARLTSGAGARALAIGTHVAFADGEYRPGTVVGDAILAHELAHTQQQCSSSTPATGTQTNASLERDADRAAHGALSRLWHGARNALTPRASLRTGLQLQRCKQDDGRLPEPAKGSIPDYDSFSDETGASGQRTDAEARAWAAMFQNPDQLDRVYSDAAAGSARAKRVVQDLQKRMRLRCATPFPSLRSLERPSRRVRTERSGSVVGETM